MMSPPLNRIASGDYKSPFEGRFIGVAILACLIFFLIPPSKATAQKKIQIIKADSIVGGNYHGATVQKIIGNVHLLSKDINMYADSAYKFSKQQKVQAYGNIEIDTKKETIWADTLTYYTDIDFSKLRGRVIFESDSTTLFGNAVDYRFTNKVAHFLDRIRLNDPQGILTANSGFYFRKQDSATFRGQVQLRDSLKYLEGDRLYSNRRKKYYEMHGNVYANDPANNSRLKGDYLEADSTGRRLVKGHAWLENYKEDSTQTAARDDSLSTPPNDSTNVNSLKKDPLALPADALQIQPDSLQNSPRDSTKNSQPDTTHIHATKIISIQNRMPHDTTTTVKAYKKVRIWSPDFAAVSDSAEYQSTNQTFQLWVNAKAWHKNIQLTGPYIRVKLKHGDIKKLVSYPDPFTVQHDTSINRLNQFKGDTLEASFEKGALKLIRVFKHSHLLRFTKKGDKPDGLLEFFAPVTKIFFKNGQLTKLKSIGTNHGNYLPESKQTASKKLKGFNWNPKQRPQRPKEMMKRRFHPIPKKPPFKLPKRYLEHIGKTAPLKISAPDSSRTNSRNLNNLP